MCHEQLMCQHSPDIQCQQHSAVPMLSREKGLSLSLCEVAGAHGSHRPQGLTATGLSELLAKAFLGISMTGT